MADPLQTQALIYLGHLFSTPKAAAAEVLLFFPKPWFFLKSRLAPEPITGADFCLIYTAIYCISKSGVPLSPPGRLICVLIRASKQDPKDLQQK
ncbi:hypothetical protein PoB_003292700 [Plakobranchus ocellatus]|uniref:Uncharacterized protein n=1 Tax=Plakobranchus ocellatus TaxID=259542 RepID=A0AAV4AHB4_9GAST|nr:hypothetical protein PoB_003292700 [Plakobranchus ocellatus]